jgi:hypothetical protein
MTKDTVFHSKELILRKTMFYFNHSSRCGIKSIDHVAYAKSETSILYCDHHRPWHLPDAVAILDPKRDDCIIPAVWLRNWF